MTFPPIPTFAPERFATVRNRDRGRYKQFRSGLTQLDEEGVVHVLRHPELGDQEPLFAGVGQLQFEVAQHRMRHEFGCDIALTPARWKLARAIDTRHVAEVRGQRDTTVVYDRHGTPLVLFASEYALTWATQDHPQVEFRQLGMTRS